MESWRKGGKRWKVMFGKRLEMLEEGRLVKEVLTKLREDGDSAGWKV